MNRYTYCGNNPIIYNDPTGQWLHIAIGAVVGDVAGGVITAVNGGDVGEVVLGTFVGAAVGAAAAFAGTSSGLTALGATSASVAVTSGSVGGAVGGAIMGAGLMGIHSVSSGIEFGSDQFWNNVGTGAWIGAAIGGSLGGGLGYINGPLRDSLNAELEPANIPGKLDKDGKMVGIDGWESLPVDESILHQFEGYDPKIIGGNIPRVYKFINEAGGETCWFNNGSKWINVNELASVLGGTYNYTTHKKSVIGHALLDVVPWILFDNPRKFHNKGSNVYAKN